MCANTQTYECRVRVFYDRVPQHSFSWKTARGGHTLVQSFLYRKLTGTTLRMFTQTFSPGDFEPSRAIVPDFPVFSK